MPLKTKSNERYATTSHSDDFFAMLIPKNDLVSVFIIARTPMFRQSFSIELTTNSPTYRRPGAQSSNYRYLVRGVTVSSSDDYSVYISSNFAAYVYFYVDSFDPSNPTRNLIRQDPSDANGKLQFTTFLQGSSQLSKRVCTILIVHMLDIKQSNKNCPVCILKEFTDKELHLKHHSHILTYFTVIMTL